MKIPWNIGGFITGAAAFLAFAPGIASAAVVYDALPDPLPPNAPSQPFQAQQTFEFGDYIHLGGTDRHLTTVTVAMSDWALKSTPANVTFCQNYPEKCYDGGFIHPITINIYGKQLGSDGVPNNLLATKTVEIKVPWRPEADPSCGTAWKAENGNCYNGYAFNAVFDLTDKNLVLPDDVIVSLAYNTQTWGANPIGYDGPFNSLNVLVPDNQTVSVGSDDSASEVFWNTVTANWYADKGAAGVGIFRKDTNWSPNGTIAMQINAVSPVGSIQIMKYACPEGTTVSRSANGVGHTVPNGCVTQAGANFGYVHGNQTDANGPYPELNGPFVAGGVTDNNGLLTIAGLPSAGRYLVAETNANNEQLAAGDILGLYCEGDGDTTGTNDNQELTFVPENGVAHCVAYNKMPPQKGSVHIFKYVGGSQATVDSVGGVSFPMITPTYGNAPFTLGPNGWSAGDEPYEASTASIDPGNTYTAYENTDTNLVGSSCDGVHPYALVGYSSGKTKEEAVSAIKTLTPPVFTINGDSFLIVWNKTCEVAPLLKVHITKYLNGKPATDATAGGYLFPMVSSWSAANIGSGTGSYTLGSGWGGASGYSADTAPMSAPADYVTSEVTDPGSQVVASLSQCVPGKFLLKGYRTSQVSFADALTKAEEKTPHQFSGLMSDAYVVVDNTSCPVGSITGIKFEDLDGDGKINDGVRRISGVTIYLDLNDNNSFDAGEPVSITNSRGVYKFDNLAAGTYFVREVVQPEWVQTYPKNGEWKVVLGVGQKAKKIDFGNFKAGIISGIEFNDLNGNHRRDAGEPVLSGWAITLHGPGKITQTAVTDEEGKYSFSGLGAGLYRVSEDLKPGWRQTVHPATVLVRSGTNVANKNFGNKQMTNRNRDDGKDKEE